MDHKPTVYMIAMQLPAVVAMARSVAFEQSTALPAHPYEAPAATDHVRRVEGFVNAAQFVVSSLTGLL
jgi:hypothetical protein